MTKIRMTKMQWMARETVLERASQAADDVVSQAPSPIDPLAVVRKEGRRLLRCQGDNFGDAFDGQLKYHASRRCFVLLYNTKYDQGIENGHHPRTRFSIAHELGHYFLDKHRAYLMGGGEAHQSRSEFTSDAIVEREADIFASTLLMPSRLARPLVNQGELTLDVIRELADTFRLSLVATSLRAVRISDFPCALVGLRDGCVAWCFRSKSLADAGFYPPETRSPQSVSALAQLKAFESGLAVADSGSALSSKWFRTYDRDNLDNLHVDEHFIPVPAMGTLVVLLSVPEDEMSQDDYS